MVAGGEKDSFAILASEGEIGGFLSGEDSAEEFAFSREDEKTTGAGGPDVAFAVGFEAIGGALLREGCGIEKNGAFANATIRVDGVGVDLEFAFEGVGDVEGFFVMGESDAVGPLDGFVEEGDGPIGCDAEDTAEIEFTKRVVFAFWETVDGIGKVDGTGGVDANVIGTVEAFAFEAVGDGHFAATFGED